MLTDEPKKAANLDPESQDLGTGNEGPESEETRSGNWREAFRVALDKARRQQKHTVSRQELGRDKSKSLFLLAALDGQLTPEDIGRTSRTAMAPKPAAATETKPAPSQDYALSKVDFSDPTVGQSTTVQNPPAQTHADATTDLRKPSLVFVRATEA